MAHLYYGPPHSVIIGWRHQPGASSPPPPPVGGGTIKRKRWHLNGRDRAIFWQSNGTTTPTPPTPPTPAPTPTIPSVSAGGGTRIFGPIDWSRFDRLKKRAKKKSKKAVQVVEEIVAAQPTVAAALDRLEVELAELHIVQAQVYRELLEMELAILDDEEDDDLLLMH